MEHISKNIILIGFMGVGKGTIARELAKQSKMFAIDTDDLIESLENMNVKEIFEQQGEEYFRTLEKKTAKWLEKSVKNSIISTGGGFFKVSNIHKIGKIVYLESSFDKIIDRILAHPNAEKKMIKRPLLQDIEKAKEIFKNRTKEYKKCSDIVINVENRSPKELAKDILKMI